MTLPEAWDAATAHMRRAQRILAITHVSPDGDAIGSLLGFARGLAGLGKQVTPACQDSAPQRFGFLPGLHEIRQQAAGTYDVIVALDSSDPQRLGAPFVTAAQSGAPVVVIDHHVTNTRFGTVNVVNPSATSTAEMVLECLQRLGAPISTDVATALLTGLVTDTLAFRTSNTTTQTLVAALQLMQHGADLYAIVKQALVMRTFDSLRLLGLGLSNAHLEGRLAYATIPFRQREELGIKEDRGDGGLAGTLITAYEVDVAAVFIELQNGDVDVSMRGQPGFDVSQPAFEFGGGGHPAAAGCLLPGPLRDAVNRVLPRLQQLIRNA